MREGVAGFIRIVQRTAEIAIVSTAKQNTVLVDFTSDPGALINAVNRLTTRTTTGGYQLEAIRESALTLMRRSAAASGDRGARARRQGVQQPVAQDAVLDDVRRSGALVHVVSVGKPSMKTMTSWNQRPTDSIHEALDETITRNTVFAEAPRRSGGRLEQVGQASGIPNRLATIAYELRDQLAVTYGDAAAARRSRRRRSRCSVKRRGMKVRAPKQGA